MLHLDYPAVMFAGSVAEYQSSVIAMPMKPPLNGREMRISIMFKRIGNSDWGCDCFTYSKQNNK